MPSDRVKKNKKDKGSRKGSSAALADEAGDEVEALSTELGAVDVNDSKDRSCTGVLASHPQSRDIHIEQFTMLFHGHDLLVDANLELNYGRRYGLIGPNGCGKSCLLRAIAARDIPIPPHIDIYLLDREAPASDMTALEMVKSVDKEKARLEAEGEALAEMEMTEEVEARLQDVYDRCAMPGRLKTIVASAQALFLRMCCCTSLSAILRTGCCTYCVLQFNLRRSGLHAAHGALLTHSFTSHAPQPGCPGLGHH